MGSEVLLSGGHNIGGLSGDNSAIGMSNESCVVPGGVPSIDSRGSNTMFSKVSLLSSKNLRGLGWGNGTIGIRNKPISMSQSGVSIISIVYIVYAGICGMSKVSSLSSKDLWGLSGGNGTTGVGHKLDSRGSSHASKENL